MLNWLRKLAFRFPDRLPRIQLVSDGFLVVDRDGTSRHVAWETVKEIFAFKRDLLTYDTIRLGFRISDDGRSWEVDEDWPGYTGLLAEIERRFDIVDKEWWSKVAFPAFATNRTTLWGRTPGDAGSTTRLPPAAAGRGRSQSS